MFFSGSSSSHALCGFSLFCTPRANHRIFFGEKPERDPHHARYRRPDLGDCLPAIGDQHKWREEFRYRRADIAGTEDAERGALLSAGYNRET